MPQATGMLDMESGRRPHPRAAAVAILSVAAATGCATQADLSAQQRSIQAALQEQSRAIQQIGAEVTRLRADVEQGGRGRRPAPDAPSEPAPPLSGWTPAPTDAEKAVKLEQRVQELEQRKAMPREIGMTPSPEGVSSEDPVATEQTMAALAARRSATPRDPGTAGTATAAATATAPQQVAAAPPPQATPPLAPVDADWKREVAQDRAVAATSGGAERAEYLGALDRLASGNCSQATPHLDALRSAATDSPLVDNVLYWKARCAAVQGDEDQAVTELTGLVSHYPKSDKAPAALWEQGQLLIRRGDRPGARAALSKLVRDYPATSEAERARRKLTELER